MKSIAVCGHFALGKEKYDGQTVKTRIVAEELKNQIGDKWLWYIDTCGVFNVCLMLPRLLWALIICKDILIFPAENALKISSVWLRFWNLLFKRNLHYIVIGGWLPEYLQKHVRIANALFHFKYIYVETINMKKALCKMGYNNIVVLPNCKNLTILKSYELPQSYNLPLRLVTFSRVMKEKGIEDCINAVINVNEKMGANIFSLDIYGQIDPNQYDWFNELLKTTIRNFNSFIQYKGVVPFNESTKVLCDSYALLFPTYYEGEGFAGTLIDALAVGIPVVASDWRYNKEIISDGITGKIISLSNDNSDYASEENALERIMILEEALLWIYNHQKEWNSMRVNCLNVAANYVPQNVIPILIKKLHQ